MHCPIFICRRIETFSIEMCENLLVKFVDPTFFRDFEGKMSSVELNFECRCQANFGLNVACRMKKWANVACRNKAFMGPKYGPKSCSEGPKWHEISQNHL